MPFLERERRTLAGIILTERTHPLELLGGVSAIARGAWVVTMSGRVHVGPVATYLEALFPIELWGMIVGLAGVLQVWGLARDDAVLRRTANLVLVAVVGAIVVGYVLRDPESIALPLYATMFVKQLWIGGRSFSPVNSSRVAIVPRGGSPAVPNGG